MVSQKKTLGQPGTHRPGYLGRWVDGSMEKKKKKGQKHGLMGRWLGWGLFPKKKKKKKKKKKRVLCHCLLIEHPRDHFYCDHHFIISLFPPPSPSPPQPSSLPHHLFYHATFAVFWSLLFWLLFQIFPFLPPTRRHPSFVFLSSPVIASPPSGCFALYQRVVD